jgi:tetratricopeptide (TPR) repeat protein
MKKIALILPGILMVAALLLQAEGVAQDLGTTLQMTQWIGNDTWSWSLTRRGNSNLYDAVARNNQHGQQSNHVFELRSFDGKTLTFYRQDAGFYYGTLSPDGKTITGKTNFGGSGNEGWRATFGSSTPSSATTSVKRPAPAARNDYDQGVALRAKGDYKGAIASLDRAIQIDPAFADSWRQRGLARSSLQKDPEALADFNRAIQLDPQEAHSYNGRASVKRKLKDASGALADVTRAIELDSHYSNAFNTRANIYYDAGNYRGAIQDYSRAAELDPTNANAWFNLGMSHQAVGDNPNARAAFERALEQKVAEPYASSARKQLAQLPPPTTAPAPPRSTPIQPPAGHPSLPETATTTTSAPPGAADPFRLNRIPLAQFEESKWSQPDRLWKTPSPIALPPAEKGPMAPLPQNLDINLLTPVNYAAAVTAAREGMRILMGPVSPEEEKKFEAKWAPLYEYPCQPVIEYFNKLNPLLNRFLDTRTALHTTMLHFSDSWEEATGSAALQDEAGVREAMDICGAERNRISALNTTLNNLARQIEALGEVPNPLEFKGRAHRRHAEALQGLQPATPFEGEWRDNQTGERWIYKILKEMDANHWLVFTAPLTRMEKAPPNSKWFLKDWMWIVERTPEGLYLYFDWSLIKSVQLMRANGNALQMITYTAPNSFTPTATFGTRSATRQGPAAPTVPVPGGSTWSELMALAQQSATPKLEQFNKWKSQSPGEYQEALKGSPGEASQKAAYDDGVQKIKAEIDRRRATDLNAFDSSLSAKAYTAKLNGKPFDAETERRKFTFELDKNLKQASDDLINQLRVNLGMSPLDISNQAASTPPPTTPPPDNEAKKEAIALCKANQVYFQSRLDTLKGQMAAAPTNQKEQFQYLIMVTEANLQAERDNEATMVTGEWTRTRTTYDTWNFNYLNAHSQQLAQKYSEDARAQTSAVRLLNMLPEGERYLEKQKLYAVLKQSTTTGDTESTVKAVQALAEKIKTQSAKENEVYQKAANAANYVVGATQAIKTAADTSMMALSFVPGGGIVYTGYLGATGYVEGGVANGVKQVVAGSHPVAMVLIAAYDGYERKIIDPKTGKEIGQGGISEALKEGTKVAVTAFTIQKVVGAVLGQYFKSGRGNPEAPTMGQILGEARLQSRMANGRAKAQLFKERAERLAQAAEQNAPPETIARLREQAEEAAKVIKCDQAAKIALNQSAKAGDSATMSRYLAHEQKFMGEVQQELETSLAKEGWSKQEFKQFSNSASAGKAGMDVDIGIKEPPRFIPNARKTGFDPNPQWSEWRKGVTKNGEPANVWQLQMSGQANLEKAFNLKVGGPGRSTNEAFLNFTTSIHKESYLDRAWLGREGIPHANFEEINPLFVQQAAEVTNFKIMHNPNARPAPPDPNRLALTKDPIPDYLFFHEQCRTLVKDMNTKLIGASTGPVNAAAPLARANKEVQQHILELRDVMNDFASNKIGPIEADRLIKEKTGGDGLASVLRQFGTILQNAAK